MNEQNNQQSNESIQSSKNIWINIILVFITAIIVGCGIYAWQYSSNQNEKQGLQKEIEQLNQKITQLEGITKKTNELTDTNDVVDNMKLISLTRDCSTVFSNYNQPVDETIINTLQVKNNDFDEYSNQGYRLREVCKYANKILLFIDFQKGYFEKAGKVSDEELYKLAENAVLGVADNMYNSINFYPVKINDYRFEGTGDVACNFDKVENDKILYICVDANDGGISKNWYAYDLNQQDNISVRYIYKGRYDSSRDEEVVFNNDLLNLFSEKN